MLKLALLIILIVEVCLYVRDIGNCKMTLKDHCPKTKRGRCQTCSKATWEIRWKVLGIIFGLGLFLISIGF